MIYTITFSPSIDLYYDCEEFKLGNINRPKDFRCLAGGKGINVSRILSALNRPTMMLGFYGGSTGNFFIELLKTYKIPFEFIPVSEPTRINCKITSRKETAINPNVKNIGSNEIANLIKKLSRVKADDFVVVSGFIPESMSNKDLTELFTYINNKKAKLVVDTSKKALLLALKFKPFLIKPNKEELSEIFYHQMISENDVVKFAKKLVSLGAENVIISLDKDGAILVNQKSVFKGRNAKGNFINSVGSGDSMIAGFIDGFLSRQDIKYAFRRSIGAGNATAYSISLGNKKDIHYYTKLVDIR